MQPTPDGDPMAFASPRPRCPGPTTLGGLFLTLTSGVGGIPPSWAQANPLTLNQGFSPNPMILEGEGGGNRPAADIVDTRQTTTGPCLGYISLRPHEEVVLETRFSNLEIWVESDLDTTLVITGPGGVWCNDDSNRGKNPAIAGDWLAGRYQIWVGAYRSDESPVYQLHIKDQS